MEISSRIVKEAASATIAQVKSAATETAKPESEPVKLKLADKQNQEEKLEVNDVQLMTEAMNKFMKSMNADLHFAMHKETQQLMVQLIDTAEQKVLKEFPPRDFLDMVAKIREYVGALLDKRA